MAFLNILIISVTAETSQADISLLKEALSAKRLPILVIRETSQTLISP